MDRLPDFLSHPISLQQEHRLIFTRDAFASDNATLAGVLTPRESGVPVRVLAFWDDGIETVFPGMSDTIARWFARHENQMRLVRPPIAVPGGEAVKNGLTQLERIWAAIHDAALCRHSYVLAIGGGAVLDVVGLGAATAHRGIPLVRMPTTSLSQADAGVGVKTGVNLFGKKNWIGTFGVPHAVVNDAAFLHRLPGDERRAGLIEAVKVALIQSASFFERIAATVDALAVFEREPFEAVIRESARQHLEHIATAGDPFERGSARPLDFGHWAAHKLEQLSNFRLGHGNAVAVGMALDLLYAIRSGVLPKDIGERILRVIHGLGFTLYVEELDLRSGDGSRRVLEGLEEFREHMGGPLTIPMIRAPGERVDLHAMDPARVDGAIDELRARYG